jgi:hypothetical protein
VALFAFLRAYYIWLDEGRPDGICAPVLVVFQQFITLTVRRVVSLTAEPAEITFHEVE